MALSSGADVILIYDRDATGHVRNTTFTEELGWANKYVGSKAEDIGSAWIVLRESIDDTDDEQSVRSIFLFLIPKMLESGRWDGL